MASRRDQLFSILPCPQDEQAAALRLVFGDLPPEFQCQQAEVLLAESRADPSRLSGLLIALADRVQGAVLVRSLSGRAAFIWPPRLAGDASETVADQLLAGALEWCEQNAVRLAQALPASAAAIDHARFVRAGFDHPTELLYLVSTDVGFPRTPPDDRLQFELYSASNHARLASIIAETYIGSLDCPALDGMRDIEDVIAGYRATGIFDPARWLLVRQSGEDVGCLLLTEDVEHSHWELMYMGVLPRHRGRRLGLAIVRHAQLLVHRANQKRLVLSVDANNLPALAMYRQAGFTIWDRRVVFIKFLN